MLISQARVDLSRYLVSYPSEAPGLLALADQLRDDATIDARSNMRGHLTSSMLVLNVTRTAVLLIHHKLYSKWIPAGGHAEGLLQRLLQSALRELEEETGLVDVALTTQLFDAPLDIDTHAIPARPSKGEGPHWHHDYMFLGLASAEFEPIAQLEEVDAVGWLALDAFYELADPRMRRVGEKLHSLLLSCGTSGLTPKVPSIF